jgi:hypothetical protein
MGDSLRRARVGVAGGLILASAGRVIDLSWHARHDDFETGMDQVQAHSVAWVGAAVLLVVSALALYRRFRTPGFLTVFIASGCYVPVAVWHFLLHVDGRDPDLPHILLAVAQLGIYVGSAMVIAGLFIPRCNERVLAKAA